MAPASNTNGALFSEEEGGAREMVGWLQVRFIEKKILIFVNSEDVKNPGNTRRPEGICRPILLQEKLFQ